MDVDTNMLAAAVLIGGIVLFSASNRKEVEDVDPDLVGGRNRMEVDEWVTEEYKGDPKKAELYKQGDVPVRAIEIAKYMLRSCTNMFQMQKWFDDNMRAQNRNVLFVSPYATSKLSFRFCFKYGVCTRP